MSAETQFVLDAAVFLTGTPNILPHAMLHNIKHNKVLHELNMMVTVITRDIPYVAPEERFYRISMYYGFKDQSNISQALKQVYEQFRA